MHTESWLSAGTTLDECIKCNICTSYCPVAAVTDLFPGPKYVGPQAQRFRENGQIEMPDHAVDYCSGCRVCNEVCPTGVRISEINARARAQIVAKKGIPFRNRILARNATIARMGMIVPSLANFVMHNAFFRGIGEKVMKVAAKAPMPYWSTQGTFTDWMRHTAPRRLKSDKKVVYFHGCATESYEPYVGKAAVLVLEHNGYEVIVPPQGCCGLPLLSNGEFGTARKWHDDNLARLAGFARAGFPIVGTSTSCILTLQEEAPELLDIHSEPQQALGAATYDIFEWLRELHAKDELKTDFKPLKMVMPYHQPCQYRAHNIGAPSADIMGLIPDLDLRNGHLRCCGIAGTYGYKTEKYDIAMAVGEELFRYVKSQGSDVQMTACDSETCRWQLEHGTDLPSRHPIEIVATAYGLYDLEKRRELGM